MVQVFLFFAALHASKTNKVAFLAVLNFVKQEWFTKGQRKQSKNGQKKKKYSDALAMDSVKAKTRPVKTVSQRCHCSLAWALV